MDLKGSGSKEGLVGLIQAITHCVTAHTKFAEWAQRLIAQGGSSNDGSGKGRLVQTKEFLSVTELASQLPLTASTIRRLARENKIPSIRMGKKIVFNLTAVLTALDRSSASVRGPRQKISEKKMEKDATPKIP